MTLLYCKKCRNEWHYKGKNRFYATCSKCLTKVNVKTARVVRETKEDE